MIIHPDGCVVCGAGVLRPHYYPRADGVVIQYCVACGSGSIPGVELDFARIYSPDYYLEAKQFGYSDDPPRRIGRNLLWKIFLLHAWAKVIATKVSPVQIIDIGAGVSPARALVVEDYPRIRWMDQDINAFANNLATLAYGPNDSRCDTARYTLVGIFEVLEHVEDPLAFLREALQFVNGDYQCVIYVPNGGIDVAQRAGADWGQLRSSLEHTLYFSADGLARLLQRCGFAGAIFSCPSAHLAVVRSSGDGGGVIQLEDWVAFGECSSIPAPALAPFAAIHELRPPAESLHQAATDARSTAILRMLQGHEPVKADCAEEPHWSYDRLIEDYFWSNEAERIQASQLAAESISMPGACPAPSYWHRKLYEAEGGRLRILYLGPKWDYGLPEQGWSYEHQNFFPTLYYSGHTNRFLHFDFVETARRYGPARMSELLVGMAMRFKPDVIFVVFFNEDHDPTNDALSYLSNHRDLPVTTVGWFCDDHYRFEAYTAKKAPFLNACVTTLAPTDMRYARAGLADKVIFSAWAANPFYYQSADVKLFQHDVSLCGLPHSDRRLIVDLLAKAGIKVSTFGLGWSNNNRATFADLTAIYAGSKINLNPALSAHGDPGQIKGRVFEAPACGGFVLTGPTESLERYFNPNLEVPVYFDYADLIDKVRLFLVNDRLRETLARNAHDRVLRQHTWEHRYADIFKKIAPRRTWSGRRIGPEEPVRDCGADDGV
jgi:spore maturation protein CgeB